MASTQTKLTIVNPDPSKDTDAKQIIILTHRFPAVASSSPATTEIFPPTPSFPKTSPKIAYLRKSIKLSEEA